MFLLTGQPPSYPHRCSVLHYQAGMDPNDRFVDTGIEFDIIGGFSERQYISEAAVREMCRLFGYPTRDEHQIALAQRDAAMQRLAQLEEEMKEYDRRFEAIDVLESADFRARRKAGRPPKAKAA